MLKTGLVWFGLSLHGNTYGVAQWLGRWSLAVRLSLICAWFMVDMWPLCGQGVRCGSSNQVNSSFYPSGVCKWVVIHGLQRWRPLKRRPGLYVRTICDTKSTAAAAVCGLWQYIWYMPLPYTQNIFRLRWKVQAPVPQWSKFDVFAKVEDKTHKWSVLSW